MGVNTFLFSARGRFHHNESHFSFMSNADGVFKKKNGKKRLHFQSFFVEFSFLGVAATTSGDDGTTPGNCGAGLPTRNIWQPLYSREGVSWC